MRTRVWLHSERFLEIFSSKPSLMKSFCLKRKPMNSCPGKPADSPSMPATHPHCHLIVTHADDLLNRPQGDRQPGRLPEGRAERVNTCFALHSPWKKFIGTKKPNKSSTDPNAAGTPNKITKSSPPPTLSPPASSTFLPRDSKPSAITDATQTNAGVGMRKIGYTRHNCPPVGFRYTGAFRVKPT